MPTWPTANSFPQAPLLSGNNETAAELALRTEMDAGPPKMRQRYTAGYHIHTYTFRMTSTNIAALVTFYETTCSGGATSFEWTHPRTAATEDWRFVERPSWTEVGNDYYDVYITLEELP